LHRDAQRQDRRQNFSIGFQNRLGRDATFSIEIKDVGGSRTDPDDFLVVGGDHPFGARRWIAVDKARFRLKHGQIGHVGITAHAPTDVEPGDYYAAVVGTALPEKSSSGGQAVASLAVSVSVQLFFTIPGDAKPEGRIKSADGPSMVWRDRDTYISIDALYENTGNVTDEVAASVGFEAALFGKDVERIGAAGGQGVVLRDSVREFRFLWNDPPWIGRFTPVVHVESTAGKPKKLELDPVWVIPSWKYILLTLLALALPIAWRVRERRRFRRLEEAVYAAHERLGEHPDGDQDEWSDEDEDR
jgi:hypothetical protein